MLWTRRLYQIFFLVRRQRRRRQGVLVWWTSNPSTSSRLEAVDFAFDICRVRLGDCIKVCVCGWKWLFSFVFSSIMIESIISHIRVSWNFSHTKICLLHWIIFFEKETIRTTSKSYPNGALAFPATNFHTHAVSSNYKFFVIVVSCIFFDYIVSLFS